MKFVKAIKKIGGGYFVSVPKSVIDNLDLQTGQEVKIDLNKITAEQTYHCKICSFEFSTDENPEDFYCPNCGNCNIAIETEWARTENFQPVKN